MELRNNIFSKKNVQSFTLALAFVGAMGAIKNTSAQVAAVAYNPAAPYQQNKLHHVKRVFLYTYELGSHSQTYLTASMTTLAHQYGFQLDISNSNSYITEATLGLSGADTNNPVNVAVFNDGDGDVLSNATSLAAMKKFVEIKGRGLYQIHAAAAYIPCPTSGAEVLTDANCHWLAQVLVRQYLSHNTDPNYNRIYVDSVRAGEVPPHANAGTAAAAIDHGMRNPEFKSIFDSLPGNLGIVGGPEPHVWDSLGDEWYNYRGYVRTQAAQVLNGTLFGPVVALLSQDETAPYAPTTLKMGDRVQSWSRHDGLGLTAYNNMGHSSIYTRTRRVHGITINDSLPTKYNWRVIRYLARDFVGCMTAGDLNFNPEASVTSINAVDNLAPWTCAGGVSINLKSGAAYNGVTVAYRGVHISIPETGIYQVMIVDASGKQFYNSQPMGGQSKKVDVSNLSKGQYYVYVTSPKNTRNVIGVNLD